MSPKSSSAGSWSSSGAVPTVPAAAQVLAAAGPKLARQLVVSLARLGIRVDPTELEHRLHDAAASDPRLSRDGLGRWRFDVTRPGPEDTLTIDMSPRSEPPAGPASLAPIIQILAQADGPLDLTEIAAALRARGVETNPADLADLLYGQAAREPRIAQDRLHRWHYVAPPEG